MVAKKAARKKKGGCEDGKKGGDLESRISGSSASVMPIGHGVEKRSSKREKRGRKIFPLRKCNFYTFEGM